MKPAGLIRARTGNTVEIQRIIRYALSIAVTLLFLLHVGGWLNIPVLTSLENLAFDARLNLTLPAVSDKKVVIIDIDEKSLQKIGRWPWNRDVMSKIIDSLFDHYQIMELGFDVVFAEPDIDQAGKMLEKMASGPLSNDPSFLAEYQKIAPGLKRDELFAQSLKGRKTIMGVVFKNQGSSTASSSGTLPAPVWELDRNTKGQIPFQAPTSYTANLKILQDAAYGGGFFDNPLLDEDGVFRRVPLLQQYGDQVHESLALALTRAALGSPRVELIAASNESNQQELFLEGVKIGDTVIPVDEKAGVLVPYIGRQKSFDYISAVDVLNKKVDPKRLLNKIAIFGTSAPGLLDLRTTPLEPAYPGVEIHANIIQGILDQRVMHKPGYTRGLEFILIFIIGLLLTFLLPLLSALWSSLTISSMLALIISSNFYFWIGHQLVLPLATPVMLVVMLFTLQMTYGFFVESRGKRQLAHLFGQYVPPELVEEMSKKMKEINLDGELREMSVLFTDVRGFTTISEGMAPKELTEFINGFLTPITRVIHEERGTIDKYMGDAVMAFWGAPLADPQHALHALSAAIRIEQQMKSLREEFAVKGWPPIYVGVGINTGEMNVGNKGSEFRVDYTVLGDAVNLGSRLEGLTKYYGVDIITSEYTRHAVPEFEYRELDRVTVKGKDKPVTIYEPLGLLETVDKTVRQDLKRFHLGLKHYRAQHWDEAEREIFALSQRDPERRIYQIYLDRIQFFRNTPPDSNWNGSFAHTSK
jgi:adenylate cyclase